MRHKLLPLLLLALPLTLSGCLTVQTVDTKAITRIKTVHLNKNIGMPSSIIYQGTAEALSSSLGGAVGGMAAAAAGGTRSELENSIFDHKVDITAIVHDEFVKAAQNGGPFTIVPDDVPADGDLSLNVDEYGLGVSSILSTKVYGSLLITAIVTAPDGTVVWKSIDGARPNDNANTVGYAPDDYLAAPEHFTEAFVKVADIASKRLIQDAANP